MIIGSEISIWSLLKKRFPEAFSRAVWLGCLLFIFLLISELFGNPRFRVSAITYDQLRERIPFLATVSVGAIFLFTVVGILCGEKSQRKICPKCEDVSLGKIEAGSCQTCGIPLEPLQGFYARNPDKRQCEPFQANGSMPFKTLLWVPEYQDSYWGDLVLLPTIVGAVIAIITGGSAIKSPAKISFFVFCGMLWILASLLFELWYRKNVRKLFKELTANHIVEKAFSKGYGNLKKMVKNQHYEIPLDLRVKLEKTLGYRELAITFFGGVFFFIIFVPIIVIGVMGRHFSG